MKKIVTNEFLSSGSWVCPAGVTKVILWGLGGGSGGSGGGVGSTTLGGNSGRAGVSCAYLPTIVTVVPGTTYTITIGAGGTGQPAAVSGRAAALNVGGDGGDTSFGSLAVFKGGRGNSTVFLTTYNSAIFGVTDRDIVASNANDFFVTGTNSSSIGGSDGSTNVVAYGNYTSWFFDDNPNGSVATLDVDGANGIAGNGSQFGPGGLPGEGGVFGGAAATDGGDADPNTGAGGGSGGGSAKSPGSNEPAGDGGDGGSGRLTIMWFE